MSILDTDLDLFKPILEGISKPSASHTKTMMESIAVSNTKKTLDEAKSKKHKSFQKKIKAKVDKQHSLINAKKMLKSLHESILVANGYVADTPAKQAFFEAINALDNSLSSMANEEGADFAKKYEILKRYHQGEKLTPEEESSLKEDGLEVGVTSDDNETIDSAVNSTYAPSFTANSGSLEKKN